MVDFVQQSWQALWAIPHIRAWLTVAWIGYLLWLGSWIVLQKREPVATISWLVSLAALPYIGFFSYYLFGPQRIRRHRLQRSRTRVGMASEVPGGDDAVELARLGLATTGLPPTTAQQVELLSMVARPTTHCSMPCAARASTSTSSTTSTPRTTAAPHCATR